ncbi:glycosyltransferase family 4 protein [Enterococcus durans]|uniref:glycosyltransferase family 4 protein n=1 Tax=Enterococcus durans TaxID=53345 RepID=UPI0035D7B415
MKITFLTYSMAPYRTKQLEHIIEKTNVDIDVLYIGLKTKSRTWKIEKSNKFREIHFKGIGKLGNHFLYYKGVKDIIKNTDILMLGGYNSTAAYQFTYYAKKYNKKVIFVFDGIAPKNSKESSKVKHLFKSLILNNVDAFFANGQVSFEYLTSNFLVSPQRIYNQYLTVDVDTINKIYQSHKQQTTKEKNKEEFVVMYSGRLLHTKRVIDLVKAISNLKTSVPVKLVIVGDGEEKDNLIEESKKLKINIEFIKFINDQRRLFEQYCLVDCLVLPSEDDAWGLVVNEAAAAHLPVIVSDGCGCIYDLVKNGYNGFVYPSKDVEELTRKLNQLVDDKEKAVEMGENSFKIISSWTYRESTNSFSKLLKELE